MSSTSTKKMSPSSESSMRRQSSRASRASSTCSQDQQSPEIFPLEDSYTNGHEQQLTYQLSPPTYTYSTFPPSSDYFTSQEGQASHYQQIPQIYAEPQFHGDYMHGLPPTLPTMGYANGVKQDAYFTDDDYLNPFGISYASLAGMETPSHHIPTGYATRVNTTNLFSRLYPHSR